MKGILYTPLKNKNFYWSNILMSDGSKISDIDFKIADIQNRFAHASPKMMGTDCSKVRIDVYGDDSFRYGHIGDYYASDTDYFPFHFILYEGSNVGNEKWNVLDVSRMKMVFDEPIDGVRCVESGLNSFICLKRGSKYNLMLENQNAIPNGHTPIEFEDYLLSDEWFDGIYTTYDKRYKSSGNKFLVPRDAYMQSLLVKKGSDYYFVGPFITGEKFLKCDSIDILSPTDVVGRVISDGSESLIVKPTMELIDDEATGKYFPYHILGRFDNVYDIDSPFQILERDGKISIFYSNFFIGQSFENGNMDLDKFLIPYISRDENKEIYWFEDIG